MPRKKKVKFEDCIGIIDSEIRKRRGKWNLTAVTWIDFDDVSQIIRIHIFKKWDLYDSCKPLLPWINRIISNQIKNIIRNNYGNYSRPCLKCAAAEGSDLCNIYEKQCNACPLYAYWEKNKKRAHDTKLPLPLEHHAKEVFNRFDQSVNVERAAEALHLKMKEQLKPVEWKVYNYLYIEYKDESDVADLMGYSTSEKNRSPGYKQIKQIKKKIINIAKKIVNGGEIDIL
jgi:DNA-directed RNA polymerase specialized sigma24 family protein